jgi:hypothetical protein
MLGSDPGLLRLWHWQPADALRKLFPLANGGFVYGRKAWDTVFVAEFFYTIHSCTGYFWTGPKNHYWLGMIFAIYVFAAFTKKLYPHAPCYRLHCVTKSYPTCAAYAIKYQIVTACAVVGNNLLQKVQCLLTKSNKFIKSFLGFAAYGKRNQR